MSNITTNLPHGLSFRMFGWSSGPPLTSHLLARELMALFHNCKTPNEHSLSFDHNRKINYKAIMSRTI